MTFYQVYIIIILFGLTLFNLGIYYLSIRDYRDGVWCIKHDFLFHTLANKRSYQEIRNKFIKYLLSNIVLSLFIVYIYIHNVPYLY